eukprot:m.128061 g.128061  ORF g.128061 m.128061 type:complete len:70 (-) comp29311_c0_seq1:66-275(-)
MTWRMYHGRHRVRWGLWLVGNQSPTTTLVFKKSKKQHKHNKTNVITYIKIIKAKNTKTNTGEDEDGRSR